MLRSLRPKPSAKALAFLSYSPASCVASISRLIWVVSAMSFSYMAMGPGKPEAECEYDEEETLKKEPQSSVPPVSVLEKGATHEGRVVYLKAVVPRNETKVSKWKGGHVAKHGAEDISFPAGRPPLP